MFQIDPKIDCAKAPVITLAGVEYFIPALSLRQSRVVVPGLLKMLPRLNAIQARLAAGDVLAAIAIDESDVELMIDIIHAGLSRAYPSASRDDLLDTCASFPEMAAALAIIAKQTGLFSQNAQNAGEPKGEATPPTSITSSPDTANSPEKRGPTI